MTFFHMDYEFWGGGGGCGGYNGMMMRCELRDEMMINVTWKEYINMNDKS